MNPDEVRPDSALDASTIDMMLDGSPFFDSDDDSIPDSTDNCRNTPNPAQYNEDGDALGDACDPCPPLTANADTDGDGVGDACDPHPNAAGDTLVLFEGFNAPLPASWNRVGTWTVANGSVTVTVGADERAYLTPPIVTDLRGVVATSVRPLMMLGNQPRAIGVLLPYERSVGASGIGCQIYATGDDLTFGLYNLAADNVFESTSFAWQVNNTYVIVHGRSGDQYRCAVNNTVDEDGQDSFILQPGAALGTRSITGSFAWLMYVDSP